ncbi:Mis12 protein-domain-containing protein [Cantharellus anzutake]|uniref:Mis12 protein-domain-containing protein n=1 Tax=Cantharellus anzutake TaxID=1750568 RepID=UPI001906C25C|nr:Mis12 protein-domain-containing protein [Cantharellus anzutake]KAF8325843.1 Mis12 protein-domain-containing protein [Cantharellus anzutake]
MNTSAEATIWDTHTAELLLAEILGFPPQMFLDDLTNIAHSNVRMTVEAVELFLRHWIDKQDSSKLDALNKELETGIAALQTLLDSHTDLAFDLFEAWAWRNIFEIPPIPMVTPHHQGLDLTIPGDEETRLQRELSQKKQKLDATRRLEVLLADAVKVSAQKKSLAERNLKQLEFLSSTDSLKDLPDTVTSIVNKIQELPDEVPRIGQRDPEKRRWEGSQSDFLAWSVARAIENTRGADEIGQFIDEQTGNAAMKFVEAFKRV